VETTEPITSERDLPLPVRVELRASRRGPDRRGVSAAEYDRLVEELLVSLGVPVAEAEHYAVAAGDRAR
jgi:hypothetical protein